MNVNPIRTNKNHKEAIKRIEKLWNRTSKDALDELEVLSTLIEAFEKKNFEILPPDPIEAIKFRMQQMNLSQKDIAIHLGGSNRVSEILSRKRSLTVSMIRNISKNLQIPAESLIG